MKNSIEHAYIMYTSILVCMLQVVTGLHWVIESNYIIFGGDVLLNCDGTACSSNSIRKWIGGPQQDLLCFNVTSSNPSKYEMMVKDKSPNFGLKIKNFTNNDVNCKYTCACGLQHYTHMLDLDDMQYIYPPQLDSNFSHQTENKYVVDIGIAVYPLPTCFIVYEMAVILVNFSSFPNTHPMLNASDSRLYKLRLQHTLQKMNSTLCGGHLHVLCEVGLVNYTVLNENITICKDNSEEKEVNRDLMIMGVIIGGICLMGLILVGVVLGIRFRRPNCELLEVPKDEIDNNLNYSTSSTKQLLDDDDNHNTS